ncbi:nitrogenase cofactor biosynthesis protein NifB [Candidatus Methanoplasma termitum]|uniref:nitrogenase cofactor biosynthesis protein NifB n=1 Tax=Candidatus Methanoplasma termitum TaxID=1577791 RepID=UPI001EE73670|nr:nitrogenase cofactor biosynthesis protein NifB [Candidatus Methanoplasma termitum]MCL2333581.1 nitrogenase cofactor biosynthesis protein NifB [Candidatus Methanoplasma sp.]
MDKKLEGVIKEHPCYDSDAHTKFARMHVPVAPRCNIQCNYCNRKYDCSNESRPGVTSEVLSPEEAVEKIRFVKEKISALKVIGIAGPGDPLANEETFRTLELVNKEFPELTLCVSTNGLALPNNAQRLYDLGVRFLTVTMNASDPDVGGLVYDRVQWGGRTYKGKEGADILLKNQLEGIRRCVEIGMVVKINIVMVPGVNDEHIPELVKKVKSLGVYIVNILPLIPVEGTKFSDKRAPTPEERKKLMDKCELDIKMMRHCKQCRADAIGLLGEDRSSEFAKMKNCQAGCGPSPENSTPLMIDIDESDPLRVAIATSDGKNIDSGFGNASRFDVYSVSNGGVKLIRTVNVDTSKQVVGSSHKEHINGIVDQLNDCTVFVVKEIGHMPSKVLAERGKTVRISSGMIKKSTFRP